jgi:hypothetical protein
VHRRERRAVGHAVPHLPELEYGERAPAPPHPLAAVEDGTPAVQLHGECDENDQRTQDDERHCRDRDVQQTAPSPAAGNLRELDFARRESAHTPSSGATEPATPP